MSSFRHVLVAIDFSECSNAAVDAAIELATRYDAALTLVHACIVPAYAYGDMGAMPVDVATLLRDAAREQLDQALADARVRHPAARAVLKQDGVAWDQILTTAREVGADLIVLGTHGRTGLRHALIGSVAERVVRHSQVPVLTVCQPKQP